MDEDGWGKKEVGKLQEGSRGKLGGGAEVQGSSGGSLPPTAHRRYSSRASLARGLRRRANERSFRAAGWPLHGMISFFSLVV